MQIPQNHISSITNSIQSPFSPQEGREIESPFRPYLLVGSIYWQIDNAFGMKHKIQEAFNALFVQEEGRENCSPDLRLCYPVFGDEVFINLLVGNVMTLLM